MKRKLPYLLILIASFQVMKAQTVSLDPSFGTAGKVINNSIQSSQTIQLQDDGKIVSCYLADFSITGNVRLARFNSDGSIDTAFGDNGFVSTIIVNETGGINMMKLQPDGKILVTGFISSNGTINASYFDFCTARFNNDGTLDTTFGANGYAITGFENLSYDQAKVIEIQSDGKILVGGHMSRNYLSSSNYSSDFAMVRYFSNGLIDTSFGTNGRFSYNFGNHFIPNSGSHSNDFLVGIRINSAGKIILGGNTDIDASIEDFDKFGFICLNSDGVLDPNFGSNGHKIVDFGDRGYMSNFKLTGDDRILATGPYHYSNGGNGYAKISMVKLLANGDFDSSFGNNGVLLTNTNDSNLIDASSDLIILSDGKIICAGSTLGSMDATANYLLIRFNADGSIDTTFNDVGYKSIDFDDSNAYGSTFLIQPDGKFLCAGSINYINGCLIRLQMDDLSVDSFESRTFSVHPNPFLDSITINAKDADLKNASLEIYDLNGRIIYQHKQLDNKISTVILDRQIPRGVYFLKLTIGERFEMAKLIKQ